MIEFGPAILAAGSWMMIIYSSFAEPRGWRVGSWFAGNETLVVGGVGLLYSIYSSYSSNGLVSALVIAVISVIAGNFIIGLLRHDSQIVSIIGFAIGCGAILFA